MTSAMVASFQTRREQVLHPFMRLAFKFSPLIKNRKRLRDAPATDISERNVALKMSSASVISATLAGVLVLVLMVVVVVVVVVVTVVGWWCECVCVCVCVCEC
jgi:hypothetical protein